MGCRFFSYLKRPVVWRGVHGVAKAPVAMFLVRFKFSRRTLFYCAVLFRSPSPFFDISFLACRFTDPLSFYLTPTDPRTRSTKIFLSIRAQFFITTAPAPWCDGRNVVFGQVVSEESMQIVRTIQKYASSHILRRPSRDVRVVGCGVVES